MGEGGGVWEEGGGEGGREREEAGRKGVAGPKQKNLKHKK